MTPSTGPAMAALQPQTLDQKGIAARIPHALDMCLLHSLLGWSLHDIHCTVGNHRDPAHPLRTASGLLAPVAIEFASQAMALHSALCAAAGPGPAGAPDAAPTPRAGYLASARGVVLHVQRLDTQPGTLVVRAQRLMGDEGQAMYHFELVSSLGQTLVQGRATVVLDGQPKTPP
jgi:predicted hotdog family 3-hydroxylacyl-ACP dehydratase